MFPSVFLGRQFISRAEYPGEVVGRMIADVFGDLTDLYLRIDQIRYGVRHSKLFYKRREAAACILPDQGAQVGFTVMEEFCQGSQGQCPVVMLDILQNQ